MKRTVLLVALASLLASPIFADDCPTTRAAKTVSAKVKSTTPSIVKTAATTGQFKTLVSLLIAADLDEALKGEGPFTVFAPTDEAFAKLPKGTIETLLQPENKAKLKAILTYHVVPNKESFRFERATADQVYEFKTLNGENVKLTKGDGFVRVNDSKILSANLLCSNGSIQVIDSVLTPVAKKNTIPVVAEKAGQFKTLLVALTTAELAEVLGGEGPFTVFAPTDEAFAKLPKGTVEKLLKEENRSQLVRILKYHVTAGKLSAKELVKGETAKTLQGQKVTIEIVSGRIVVNKSNIVSSDLAAENGIIHVIDQVLMPSHD
jgi:transforming growth factor-beta-induced protein